MLKLLWYLLIVGFPKEPSAIKRCCHEFEWKPETEEFQKGTCKICGWMVVKPIDVIDEDDDYEEDENYWLNEKEKDGC